MKGPGITALAMAFFCTAATAAAHPVPFSYLDVRLEASAIDVTLVAHVFDVAHDLGVEPSDRLLDPGVLQSHAAKIIALVADRAPDRR